MAGVLIGMKIAVLRHAWRGGQSSMLWSGATLGVLLAIGTMSAIVSVPIGQAIDTLAIAFGLWAMGWMMLPLIGGSGGDPLRPEVFRLTAIPPRRLALGLLIAGGVGVLPLVSVLAFGSLVVVAARLDLLTVIVAIVGVALMLSLVVALSRVVVGALGRAMETRLGLELAAIQYALILGFSLFWIPLILLSTEGAGGKPGSVDVGLGVGEVARILPTGWVAVAVEAAGRSDWGVAIAALGGLIALIGLLSFAWTAIVARRLELSSGMRRRPRRPLASLPTDRTGRGILGDAPLNGVVGRELRTWVRHPRRGLELRVAIWSAILLAVAPALLGSTALWPWAGAIVVVIAGNGLANVYGMDGTSFWLTLSTPGSERIDVRGRQLAWLVVVGTIGILASIVLTFASGHLEATPWVAAAVPALLGGAAGLGILLSVATPAPLPERRGGDPLDLGDDPTTGGNLMIHGVVMSLAVPALAIPALLATSLVPVAGVFVGMVTGVLLAWTGGAIAIRRLERAGPETLERLRARPAARPAVPPVGAPARPSLPRWRSIARNALLLIGALLVFPQGLAALGLKLTGSDSKVWFAALYLPEPWPVPAAIGAVVLGLAAWYLAWRVGRRASARANATGPRSEACRLRAPDRPRAR
jgi:ABC-2 type transport system permease protein